MNKIFLLIPLLIIIPFAQAEKIEIDIPFDSHGYSCTITDTIDELIYTCIFEGNIQTFTENDLKNFESVLTENQIDEIIEQLNIQELKLIEIEKSKLSSTELKIKQLQEKYDKGKLNSSDIEYLRLLKSLDTCESGIGKARQIQDYRSFEISEEQTSFGVNQDFRKSNGFHNLVLAIEECKAQTTLENKTLSEQYNNIVGSEILQRDFRAEFENVQAIPFDKFRATTAAIDLNAICENNQLTQSHKKGLGCVIKYDGQSLREIEIENKEKFGNDGMIHYESEVLKNYNEFMLNYYD